MSQCSQLQQGGSTSYWLFICPLCPGWLLIFIRQSGVNPMPHFGQILIALPEIPWDFPRWCCKNRAAAADTVWIWLIATGLYDWSSMTWRGCGKAARLTALFEGGSSFQTCGCTGSRKIQLHASSSRNVVLASTHRLSIDCVSSRATNAREDRALAGFLFFDWILRQVCFLLPSNKAILFPEDADWVSLEYFITLSSSMSSTSLPGPINQSAAQPFSAARHRVPKVSRTLFVTETCRPGENGAAKDCHFSENQHLWI